MKTKKILSSLLICMSVNLCMYSQPVTIDYFGQEPPGDSAVIFAPDSISLTDRFEECITFSNDGKECLLSTVDEINWTWADILYARYENNQWGDFEQAEFIQTSLYFDIHPFFSPDGNSLFFSSARPSISYNYVDIWKVDREGSGWNEPVKLNTVINSSHDDTYPSVAMNGNLYYGIDNTQDIWYSKLEDGEYRETQRIEDPIKSGNWEGSPCIAPDESFMIFASIRPEGFGEQDLYISYHNLDGSWTNPENLGDKINSPDRDKSARLSPDLKYLFFERSINKIYSDIYWVNADFIESLKPSKVSDHKIASDDLVFFPNPTNQTIQIKANGLRFYNKYYTITDLNGRIVKQGSLDSKTIDIPDLSKGIYIINIKTDKATISKKIVIE